MIAPKTNAPKISWMPIRSVASADSRIPTRTTAKMSGVIRPEFLYQFGIRARSGLTTRNITAANTAVSATMRTTASGLLPLATA